MFGLLFFAFVSCVPKTAEPIKLNSDTCEYCKMTIVDGKFGAEIITSKGRVYKFDDIFCMISYHKENSQTKVESFYIHDFNQNNVLILAEKAFYVKGGTIKSPMHGNVLAVQTEAEAIALAVKFDAKRTTWPTLLKGMK